MKREPKIHFLPNSHRRYTICGTEGQTTYVASRVTCRRCQFAILADVAPWARPFLDELRQLIGSRELPSVAIPRDATEPVDRQIERYRAALGSPFREQPGSQKAIREFLSEFTPRDAAVQEVVYHGGPAAAPVGVQPGQVAEQPGDAGQIGDESFGCY